MTESASSISVRGWWPGALLYVNPTFAVGKVSGCEYLVVAPQTVVLVLPTASSHWRILLIWAGLGNYHEKKVEIAGFPGTTALARAYIPVESEP